MHRAPLMPVPPLNVLRLPMPPAEYLAERRLHAYQLQASPYHDPFVAVFFDREKPSHRTPIPVASAENPLVKQSANAPLHSRGPQPNSRAAAVVYSVPAPD